MSVDRFAMSCVGPYEVSTPFCCGLREVSTPFRCGLRGSFGSQLTVSPLNQSRH